MWRILTIVSAEPGQEGDSRDAKENRNGYFMIWIMETLTSTRRGQQCLGSYWGERENPGNP